MMKRSWMAAPATVIAALIVSGAASAAENLKLKPGLDYMQNAWQGPIIEGDKMWDGVEKGKPNYIFMYAEFCYDAKRQAERTVEMYRDYGDRVHFVIIDLSRPIPKLTQMPLLKKYFGRVFPHTTILDGHGKVMLDYTGETDDATLMGWLDAALRSGEGAGETAAVPARPPAPGNP
ncbi:MAG TPA: hypothetical protein VL523_05230 [Terriglobia bacterium]|nr:hypothetical protein [Terriglobia bacterium]